MPKFTIGRESSATIISKKKNWETTVIEDAAKHSLLNPAKLMGCDLWETCTVVLFICELFQICTDDLKQGLEIMNEVLYTVGPRKGSKDEN